VEQIDTLADAIASMEGFFTPGTIAANNNNPGNLTASSLAVGNVNGYSVFANVQDGWDALYNQLDLYASRGMTLEQMVDTYLGCPGGVCPNTTMTAGNDPSSYLNYLTSQVGVGPSTTISSLYEDASTTTATVSNDVSQGIADNTDSVGSEVSSFLSSGLFSGDGGDGSGGWLLAGLGVGLVAWAVMNG
jgi:hypothetical protein